ncbi:hypothetical protein Lser_V15G01517 [Lactuca serriola]
MSFFLVLTSRIKFPSKISLVLRGNIPYHPFFFFLPLFFCFLFFLNEVSKIEHHPYGDVRREHNHHRPKRVKNMASSSVVGVSTLHDKDESYLNSEKYAEELQLQEALIYSEASISSSSSQQDASSSSENDASSISSSSSQNDTSSTPSSASQNDASSTSSSSSSLNDSSSSSASSIPETSTPTHSLKMKEPVVTSDASQSSESFFCDICMDTKSSSEMFSKATVCGHLYCSDCISGHVSAKIKENITNVKCPDPKCKEVIGPEHCRAIVPKEVLERWEEALCESLILGTQKFYCPFKDCSVMLVDDGGESVTSSECPNCHRLFCAQCKVAWHSEMDCNEFQSLNEDERNPEDIMLMQLAKSKEWRRCPSCNIIVEKQEGYRLISLVADVGIIFVMDVGKYMLEAMLVMFDLA